MTDVPPGNEPPPYPGQQPNSGQQPNPEPQPYQGQQPYQGEGQQYPPQQPAYGGGFRPKHPQAVTVLVLGIVGFLFCQILGPVAWIMGNKGIKEVDANPAHYDGRTELLVGKILGIVSTVFLILGILGFLFFISVFGLAILSDPEGWAELESGTYSGLLSAL